MTFRILPIYVLTEEEDDVMTELNDAFYTMQFKGPRLVLDWAYSRCLSYKPPARMSDYKESSFVEQIPGYLRPGRMSMNDTRFHVDGHEFDDTHFPDGINDSNMSGTGQFPPFRIFDDEMQEYIPGEYRTRKEAERVRMLIIRP